MKDINCPFPRLTKVVRGVACMALCSIAAHAQPTITNVFPNGAYQFQATNSLSFTVNSTAGVTNLSVALTVTSLTGNAFLENLSPGDGLTVTGPATSENVTASLDSDTLYSVVISATDANGLSTSASAGFDTINPSYLFEAEDWDYGSGKFIDNPQVNQYAGLLSTLNVDYTNANPGSGNSSYRPQGMETEDCGDVPRLPYIGTTNVDFDVGYATTGGWANYTRHFPAGLYNVYARLADGNGAQTDCAEVTVADSQSGNAALLGASPYSFNVKSTGWQTYRSYPLVDANGSLVQFTNDGTKCTLTVTTTGGNYNVNYFFLVPANTNGPSSGATISGVYPDGTTQFQNSNSMSFSVSSSVGVSTANVIVQLTGTNLVGRGSIATLTEGHGLTITGTADAFNVSLPLTSNQMYSAFIQVVDNDGNPSSTNLVFDTVVPLYTFEAEDFDYDSGQFFDNPQTNAYFDLDGVSNIDWYVDDPTSGSHTYRQNDYGFGPAGPETEGCGDVPRDAYTNGANTGFVDYDVGFNDPANWENYTRHYPAGTYNVYMRGANGGGGNGSANLNIVSAGLGTTNQTVQSLGTFTVPATGNWQSYVWEGLKDQNGNLVKVTFSGSAPETLRVSGPSSCNANYYMLMPADTSLPVKTGLYPNGLGLFQQTNTLAFTVTSSDGIATNAIVVTLNGTAVPLTYAGSSTSWYVSYPHLQNNTVYNATISVLTLGGNSSVVSYSFDTYAPNNYQFEGADYDYTSNNVPALFFDNPQIDRYSGLLATPGIDEAENTSGAPLSEDVYRPSPDGVTVLVCTQGGGDATRPQFGSNPTWRINWFGFGDFCNYTRHYPAGSYNVIGRFTEGGGVSSATLYKVTAGVGTANQTTSLLGTFNIPENGWNGWEYATLVDGSGAPIVASFDGSQTTLQLQGPVVDDGQTINAGFFMLVPTSGGSGSHGPTVTATVSAGNINISFPTVTGTSYQVVFKNTLTDATWQTLGSPISGNNAVQSVQYPATGAQRFYQIQVQ